MVAADIAARVPEQLPGWHVEGKEIVAAWRFADFAAALAATVMVGALAERADHHPDLTLSWGRLAVRLTTHSAGRLTEKDLDLALAIQEALGPPA